MVEGPLQIGWGVAVENGTVVFGWFKPTDWVELRDAELDTGESVVSADGVCVDRTIAGPRGIFHLYRIITPHTVTPITAISKTRKVVLCLGKAAFPGFILP